MPLGEYLEKERQKHEPGLLGCCINCGSKNNVFYRDEDGNWVKKCFDCEYEWGPFTSTQTTKEPSGTSEDNSEMSLEDFM